MCALTKSMVAEFDPAEKQPDAAINYAVLKDLARLDGQHERHGTLLGTSAVTALLLQALVDQVKAIADEIAAMKIGDQSGTTPTGSGAAPAPAQPGPAASRFGVVATVDANSVQAISAGVGTVLAQTIQHPLAEIRAALKIEGDHLAQLDLAQAADRKQLDALAPDVATLQKSVTEIHQRLDRLDRAMLLTGHQLLKLHGAVGGLSGDIADFEEMTEAVRRHVAALDVEVAGIEDEIDREGSNDPDRNEQATKRGAATRKPKHK